MIVFTIELDGTLINFRSPLLTSSSSWAKGDKLDEAVAKVIRRCIPQLAECYAELAKEHISEIPA